MSMSNLAEDDVQVSLLATSGHAGLAVGVLSQRFGLTRRYAENILDQGYGLLSPRLNTAQARAAVPLLAALGLRVALQPVESMPPDEFCDVSVRLKDQALMPKLAALLDTKLGLADLQADAFAGPQGLVVPGLSPGRAEWLAKALQKLPGVFVAVSEHRTARHDLFAAADLAEADYAAVRSHMRLLGGGSRVFGDAICSGLEYRVLQRILARFPDMGLFGVNQAFQRYELLVIGKGSLSMGEFADFMMPRPAAQGISARLLTKALPLQLDHWLTRPAARQFLADCGSIGIHAVTRLIR